MDTLTHIALGACVGELMLGKPLGKKAWWIGALANSIPDFDFITSFWLSTDENLLAHRGITHSILFAVLGGTALGLLFQCIFRSYAATLRQWILFFIIQMLIHIFLDGLNNYGTGWFEPFNNARISLNVIFVADPFYSVWLVIAFIAILLLKDHVKRLRWALSGLILSSLYLLYCAFNKVNIDNKVKGALQKQNITYTRYLATPTPLNNWLWYVAIGNDSGFNIGYYSVFDKKKKIEFHFFPHNDSLLTPIFNKEDVQNLIRFSKGYYTIEQRRDTLIFNDLRFGQVVGWYNPQAPFAFHYYLTHKEYNKLVVQRGRFKDWTWATTERLLERIWE